MSPRIDYWNLVPEGAKAFRQFQAYVDGCGIEHKILELVKMRASQINGCAFCLDMHSKDARAALAWTEAVTRVSSGPVEDALFEEVRRSFSEKELVNLTFAIIAINGWNRLAIPFRSPAPGGYRAPRAEAAD